MNVSAILETDILPIVEKPSRYLGTEVNAVFKDRAAVDVRLALVFPDLYDIGLGNLGLHILYAVLNQIPWVWAERAYAPAPDMEAALRERDLPLFALESKDSLGLMDGIGFTLQSELTYTNILNVIDMAGIPLRTADRTDEPLTFAGGPAVFNPEPLALFMDFFVIGDGEDVVVEIAEVLRRHRGGTRKEKLLALSLLEGVYVPALYPFETLPNGWIVPQQDYPKIRKRLARDLNAATFPVDSIVPFTRQVHDRASLEVLRGCTQGCRFCQAGMTTRPVRERSIDNIETLMRRTLASTGYDEVSLVSLSTCDYSQVQSMVARAVKVAHEERVSVSLPSLRLDSFSVSLADMVAETRKSGITFAPEAASPRLRAVINKFIPDEELLEMSSGAFTLGWDLIKLYFMLGLPTERDEDIEAIADLALRTLAKGRKVNPRAKINLGVSTFVPKPFTPFQWAAQIGPTETERKQRLLGDRLGRHPAIKFGRHHPEETFLEGLTSRADRRVGELLERVFRKGARFEAWSEHLRFDLWVEAIDELGFDVADQLRERDVDERLPWDHLDVLIHREWFVKDWQASQILQHAQDCRAKKCHKCGVIDFERDLCATMLRDHVKGRPAEAAFVKPTYEQKDELPAVQRLAFRYGRTGNTRFLSHLEAMEAWMRTLRRARAPMAYSNGFHPHAKVAFSAALPAGEETLGDWMDLRLRERVDPQELFERMRATLPTGFELLSVHEIPLDAPALMAAVSGADYTLVFPDDDRDELAVRAQALLDGDDLVVERRLKAKKRKGRRHRDAPETRPVDMRPMIHTLRIRPGEVAALDLEIRVVDGKHARPRDIVALLSDRPERVRVIKRETHFSSEVLASQETGAPFHEEAR